MQLETFVPYPIQENPIISFSTVTNWTTLNLLSHKDIKSLARAYPKTLESTDIVFVVQNEHRKNWGSIIGHLSLIEHTTGAILPLQGKVKPLI